MVLPANLLLRAFSYGPMFGLVIAFSHARNTVGISILKLAFGFTAPIALALAINEVHHRGTKRFFQTVSYLPHFISWVIVGGMGITPYPTTVHRVSTKRLPVRSYSTIPPRRVRLIRRCGLYSSRTRGFPASSRLAARQVLLSFTWESPQTMHPTDVFFTSRPRLS